MTADEKATADEKTAVDEKVSSDTTATPAVLASGYHQLRGIVIDATYIYFADFGTNNTSADGKVLRVAKTGGQVQEIAHDQGGPYGLALDAPPTGTADQVFWTNNAGGQVYGYRLSTSQLVTYSTSESSPGVLVTDQTWLYFVTGNQGTIRKINIADHGSAGITTGQAGTFGLAIDSNALYWTNSTAGGSVGRFQLSNGSTSAIATGQDHPFLIASDGANVYWTDSNADGDVMKAPADGSGAPTVLVAHNSQPIGITYDATYVYWANSGTGNIMRARIDGTGTPTVIAVGVSPGAIAVDATNVYWTNTPNSGTADAVLKMAKP